MVNDSHYPPEKWLPSGYRRGLTTEHKSSNQPDMNRHIWDLHSAVFELARARGLRQFEVHYADSGDEIQIDLAIPPANDTPSASEPVHTHPDTPC